MDYAFARHPRCPRCGGQRSRHIVYGLPNDPRSWEPWIAIGGCRLCDENWTCELCRHNW
ncbi:alkylphosphonate transporter [Mycolicibacterium rufum]|nr:alkylphosphonate transporter [Mycolicibacterium rufum]